MRSSGHAVSAPDACSVGFDAAEVSAFGTAAQAMFFIALEQAGPWGRDAATESHLPATVGRSLSAACSDRGGRLSLIRRPGRHADATGETRTAYLAWSGPDPWLLSIGLVDPALLLQCDLDALARGDRAAVLESLPGARACDPVLLICTNGRRDVCCAVRGRPVVDEVAATHPGRVWEASHTGGHRYAPTGVLLPHGATLARLDGPLCAEVLSAADRGELPRAVLGPAHDRGRSALEPAAQAAESHVRQVHDVPSLADLSVTGVGGVQRVEHRDGRVWTVRAERVDTTLVRPESCGKTPVPVAAWRVLST